MVPRSAAEPAMTSRPPPPRPPGRWTSSSTTSGPLPGDHRNGLLHRGGLPHHLDACIEVGFEAGPENGVVVHNDHPDGLSRAERGLFLRRCS